MYVEVLGLQQLLRVSAVQGESAGQAAFGLPGKGQFAPTAGFSQQAPRDETAGSLNND